ncbi:MAG: leishmanolysin-related zinc metalloendopeptidase [Myxococcota bacterium]
MPIDQDDPSLSGDGDDVYFASDDPWVYDLFGAPIIIRFATDGSSGAISFAGEPGVTTAIRQPSASFAGDSLLFSETRSGVDTVELFTATLGQIATVYTGPVDHPFLTADGASFAFAEGAQPFRAAIDFDDPSQTAVTPIPHLGLLDASATTFAQELPPPPPPPPGTLAYDGSTVGAPTFDRPNGLGPALVGPVAYDAYAFTPTVGSGFYTVDSAQDYDGYLHLYRAPFDPAQPLTNVIAANDDLVDNRHSGFRLFLEDGVDYVLVTSAWGAGDEGTFTNTITPPLFGDDPTVELFEQASSIVEPGATASFDFFVSSLVAISCEVDFGDGAVQGIPCAPNAFGAFDHVYASPGHYTVRFTATSATGAAEALAFPTVTVDDPTRFDVVVVFGAELSATQRDAFLDAADTWSRVIVGDLAPADSGDGQMPEHFACRGEPPFQGHVDDLVITALVQPIDGPGAVLGSAGPCVQRPAGTNGALAPLPLYGTMRFDVADLDDIEANGTLQAVITHEMAHVLGIGTLWRQNGLLTGTEAEGNDPTDPSYDPRYVGPLATQEYGFLLADAGLPSESTVPAANTGGTGTRESHWREATFANELMTGYIDGGANPLSALTIGSLDDVGYTVDYGAAEAYALPTGARSALVAPLGRDEALAPTQK